MKLSLRTFRLSALLLLLLGLAACSCGDREDRLARIRGAHGRDAAGGAAEPEVALSPGAKLYREKTCNTCHGDDGIKALLPNYPVIARQGRDYALKQMLDIQSGSRTNGQSAAMKAVVATVTLEEFEILADYVANELGGDAPIGTGVVDPESPGAKLYMTKTCVACHGADGKSPILAEYPRITRRATLPTKALPSPTGEPDPVTPVPASPNPIQTVSATLFSTTPLEMSCNVNAASPVLGTLDA